MLRENRLASFLSLLAGVYAGLTAPATLAEEAPVMEEIVVTGSRIVRSNLSQPTPVTTLSQEDLRLSGSTDLGRLLAELPAVGSTGTIQGTSNSFGDLAGLNLPDLRRLGTSRTLTLVNGKRHVGGSPGTTAVDLGSIPTALVERVEVITGGASAIYGSDAVSGVINIIKRDDFEGVAFDVFGGRAADDDYANNHQASLTVGHNFDNGRGNFTFTLMRDRIGNVQANDLDHAKNYGTIVNPNDTGEFDGVPDRLLVPNVLSERLDENGVLFPFGGAAGLTTPFASSAGIAFDRNGNPTPQTVRDQTNSFAFGSFPNGCENCFELEDYITITPEVDRETFQGTVNYQLADWSSFYADVKYVNSDIKERLQPDFNFGDITIDVANNPFLNEDLRDDLLAEGVGFAPMARFHGFDPAGRENVITRETTRIVTGFEGSLESLAGTITYDIFYNRGETNNKVVSNNQQVPQNFQAAINAVEENGEVVCAEPDDAAFGDCVPFNPFGEQNTADAIAFSFVQVTDNQMLLQENAGLSLVSDTSDIFELPAGPVEWAAGIEWRREFTSTDGDALVQADLTTVAAQPDQEGGFEVFEGFLEVSVPILAGQFLAEDLTLDGAVRSASYTHTGSADAWKIGLIWQPIQQLTIRGTISEAVRAPNIEEAFLPTTPGFFSVSDPCDADQIADDPDRAANCAALGIPAGFEANDNVSIDGVTSGNPDLDPEDSDSFTWGVIYEPLWAEGLAITLDFYDIEITEAITQVPAQDIADNCVDATGGLDPTFCSLLTRDPVTNDLTFVESTFVNASKLETDGIDLELSYNKQLSDWTSGTSMNWMSGYLQVTMIANYLGELREFVFENRPSEVDINRGEIGDPIRQFRTSVRYSQGNWRVGWTGRFIGSQKRYEREEDICEDTSPCDTDTIMYHDLNARYTVSMGNINVELYGGINNVADEEPPVGFLGQGANGAIYDAVGRYYFLGVRGSL